MSITTRPEAVVARREPLASLVRRVRIRNDRGIGHAAVALGPSAVGDMRTGSGTLPPPAVPRLASRVACTPHDRIDRDRSPAPLADRSYGWSGPTGRVSGAAPPPPPASVEIALRAHLRRGDARLVAVNQLASDGPPIRLVGIEGRGTGSRPAPAGASIVALREASHTRVSVPTHGTDLIDRLGPGTDGLPLSAASGGGIPVTGLGPARVVASSGSTWTRRADRSAWLGSNQARGPGAAGDA